MNNEELARLASRFGVPVPLVEEILKASLEVITDRARQTAERVVDDKLAYHVLEWHEPSIGSPMWLALHRN